MSVRFGLDSTSPISPAAHHAVGSTVALRYLSRYSWKVVTRAEYDANLHSGIDTTLVFEDGARNAWAGYAQGKADAEFALKQASALLGLAHAQPVIRFAVDDDTAGRPEATDAYFDGVKAVLFYGSACGPYGGFEVVRHQSQRGFEALWQTYAWSRGVFWGKSQLYQYSNGHTVGGRDCDFNRVYGDAWVTGAWNRRTPAPVDPHGYLKFQLGPFKWGKWHHLNERALVEEYDRLRPHALIHAHRLGILRGALGACRDRIWWAATHDLGPAGFGNKPQLPDWNYAHRGWRFQQLAHRAKGKKVV